MKRSNLLRGSSFTSSLLPHCVPSAAGSRALYYSDGLGGRAGNWVEGVAGQVTGTT